MSDTLLTNLMRVAVQNASADRGMACDNALAIIATVNLEQSEALSEKLTELVTRALASGKPYIGNNAVRDVVAAPRTNTSFDNLRGIVVIPVPGKGAIYLDRPIRKGLIPQNIVNALFKIASQAQEAGQPEPTEAYLQSLYQQIIA